MNNLFQYVPGDSVIHRMNPVTKIFLTIVICIAAFISGNLFYLAALLAVDLMIGFVAGVPGKTLTIFKGFLCCRFCWCAGARRSSGLSRIRAC